ncbi:uncharacterized protein CTRU02_206516 [Colletotrichum truncatum]|uniref:Uncharacterized protein n=1 Tax=Colletotrichum truncatum TaxID=5467 RepID=A0ACC3Z767_COLTU|nr:uncharacterized protein CTRU02_11888 [Colletotrichum truncatum]KAF6785263.1 hypothetical protein CTRU02_11888 [Colletotrichum truncatum]
MKFTAIIASAVLLANPILAGVAPAEAAAVCGSLGVMTYTDAAVALKGADPAMVRACKEHPLGPSVRPSGAVVSPGSSNAKRNLIGRQEEPDACLKDNEPSFGCTDGYCWKRCGEGAGRWCWTAWNGGFGSWRTCGANRDCGSAAGSACGEGCSRCGCGC